MIAGTLARLENPVDEPVGSFARDGDLPALEVDLTQSSFDDRPIQRGVAAKKTETTKQFVSVSTSGDELLGIDVNREPAMTEIATDWVADVTGTGIIAAESADGDGEFAFPFDMFYSRTGEKPQRLRVDVEALHIAWDDEDVLGDVWMSGADDGDGASIDYHSRADPKERPSIGLGFERPWSGTVMRGVVYESGYLAIYNANSSTSFIRFVEEELLEFTEVVDNSGLQATLGQATEDDDDDDGDSDDSCEECGREVDHVVEGLCAVCRDLEDEKEAESYAGLDTVTMSDGGADDGE